MKFSHYFEYAGLLLLSRIARFLSVTSIQKLGNVLGFFAYYFVPIRKTTAREQIKCAFPDLGTREVETILKDSYASLSKSFLEVFKMSSLSREELLGLVEVEGREFFDRGLERGHGIVVVSFHMGNWELMGAVSVLLGYPIDVIYQRQSNPLSDNFINRNRRAFGMGIIERRQAVKESMRSLKKNRIVAFISDQDAHQEGVFAPLFGRPASTPRGPAVLSLRLKAPIVTSVILRNDDGSHRFVIRPLEVDLTGDTEHDVYAITCAFNRRLEEYVREKPGQWLWHHRRWKTVPSEGQKAHLEAGIG